MKDCGSSSARAKAEDRSEQRRQGGRKPKFTPHQTKEARQSLAKGEKTRDLAASYSVSRSTNEVGDIVNETVAMLLSTLIPAIVAVALVYFLLIRLLPWRWLSYGLALAIGGGLISARTVHLQYTGVDVAGLGCLITWLDPMGYWRKTVVAVAMNGGQSLEDYTRRLSAMTMREFNAEASLPRNKFGEEVYQKERALRLQMSNAKWTKIAAIVAAIVGGLIVALTLVSIFKK
jgi:hypothetical protein